MHIGCFPFVECGCFYACGGGNILDAATAKVDGGTKQGFGFCKCGVLLHGFHLHGIGGGVGMGFRFFLPESEYNHSF